MAKKGYPWPDGGGFPSPPLWRGRHQRMGDTIPPSRPPGPPSPTNSCPFSESKPSGLPSGYYSDYARAMGYHEPPTVEKVNRPTYDLSAATDQIAEKDDAILFHWAGEGLALGTTNQIDLLDPGFDGSKPTFYTGPADATNYSGPDVYNRCSNYVAIRDGSSVPILDPSTGTMVHVIDVLDGAWGTSLYSGDIRPGWDEVYPYGSFAIVGEILTPGPASPSQITFEANTPPSGTPAAGAGHPVCFFNYSLFERILSAGGEYPIESPFAISLLRTAGAPDTYDLNRDVAVAGWEKGDVVYTTFVAYRPTLVLESAVPIPANVFVLGGAPWPAGFGDAYRFMVGSRMVLDPWAVLPMPLEAAEPPSATLRSFDYANALIRARDGTMKGTVLFDAMGSGYSPEKTWDPYAGFLHRKLIEFTSEGQPTQLPMDAPCSLAVGTVTLLNSPPDQFRDSDKHLSHLIPYIDLFEITDASTGKKVGLFPLQQTTGTSTANVLELDGTVPAATVANGTIRVYRTYFLSAGDANWPSYWRAAGVFVGEALGPFEDDQAIPLMLHAAGTNFLMRGYNGPWEDRLGGAGTDDPSRRIFEIVSYDDGYDHMQPGDFAYGRMDHVLGTSQAWRQGARHASFAPNGLFSQRFENRLWTDFAWDAGTPFPHLGGDPNIRIMDYSFGGPEGARTIWYSTIQIEPNLDNGIDLAGGPTLAASLFLGGPSDGYIPGILDNALGGSSEASQCPTFGYLTERGSDSAVPTQRVYLGGMHRAGAPDFDDMWFRLWEGPNEPLAPTIDPAYCRFEVAWDTSGGGPPGEAPAKFNFGWPTWRTFVHPVGLAGGHGSGRWYYTIEYTIMEQHAPDPIDTSIYGSHPPDPSECLPPPIGCLWKTAWEDDWYLYGDGYDIGTPFRWVNVTGGWEGGAGGPEGPAWLNFALNLPDGCDIVSVEVVYQAQSPMYIIKPKVRVYKQDHNGGDPTKLLEGIGVLDAGPQTITAYPVDPGPPVIVDNASFMYYVLISTGMNQDPDQHETHSIWSVTLTYKMRDFLPA